MNLVGLMLKHAARVWAAVRPMSLDDLAVQLGPLARDQRFADLVAIVGRHPRLRRRVRRALAGAEAARPGLGAIHMAELIVCAWIGVGLFDRTMVRDWLLPLLRLSTENWLTQIAVGRYLIEHLDQVDDPAVVVRAIEARLVPATPGDCAHLHTIFSMKTWPTLRRHVTRPCLASELELFVTATDRAAFWHEFHRTEVRP